MKFTPIVAIPVQTAATISGTPIPTQNMLYCTFQSVATGSAGGTMKLQASNDNPVIGTGQVPTNWSDIPTVNGVAASITVSGAGAVISPVIELCYQWVRVVYTNTGTGTIGASLKIIGF